MAKPAKPIPDGYHGATPYLCVKDAARGIDFYKRAFGATERMRMDAPGGKVGHAEILIGEAVIMLADEHPEIGFVSPETLGGSPVLIHVYVPDVDALVERAVAAGAKLTRPVQDQFYGDRGGKLDDPFGHQWYFATHIEDVSPEEMRRRAEKLHGGG
jgi:PhnB protein